MDNAIIILKAETCFCSAFGNLKGYNGCWIAGRFGYVGLDGRNIQSHCHICCVVGFNRQSVTIMVLLSLLTCAMLPEKSAAQSGMPMQSERKEK